MSTFFGVPAIGVEQRINLHTSVLAGRGTHAAFGHRTGLDLDDLADIWMGVAARRPLPLVAQAMEVVSSSAADAYPTSGALLIVVSFIDENGDWRSSDLLPMAGLTPVAITYKADDGIFGDASRQPKTPSPPGAGSAVANVFRVIDSIVVIAAGATELLPYASNIGTISVQAAGAGTVFEVIPATRGRSRSSSFHVPRGCAGRLTYASAATERGRAELSLAVNFGLGTAWQEVPITSVNDSTAPFLADPATTPLAPRSDIIGRVKAGTNNIDVAWLLQFRIQRTA